MAGGDLCSVPGIMKMLESVLIFITLIIHRHGDNGEYLFFATTALKLNYSDPGIDAENLGNSALVGFMVINLVLLLTYFIDGRQEAHNTILEPMWNLLGACMFIGTAVITILTWKDEQSVDTSSGITETQFYRNVTAALVMAGLCILIGVMYLVDTVVAIIYRRRYADEYQNP